ncbi:ANTAR domain-containing response regulator [Humitalea rosea]|uniref:ANTAR domain-containing response regulator n=1 Tax=Humitalea rosea TaxID=990373 RepID=UPI001FE5F27B|nr:ANTAR domain-containing protein [Humitalea rosea]
MRQVLRVLLVDGDPDRAAAVREGLEASGCEVVGLLADLFDLVARVRACGADVLVCALDDPSRDAIEAMALLNRNEPRPVVLFAQSGGEAQIEAALEAGVAAYVIEGLAPARVRPVMEVAIRRFRAHEALKRELSETRATLAERKIIERAKGHLMRGRRLTEAEAHATLRRMAMDRGQRLVEAARGLLPNDAPTQREI